MNSQNESMNLWIVRLDFDINYTCNKIPINTSTFITIDEGWATIPETIVIDTIIALIMVIPFVLPRLRNFNKKCASLKWMDFFYGEMGNFFTKLTHLNKRDFRIIETYLVNIDKKNLFSLLPQHLGTTCRRDIEPSLPTKNNDDQTLVESNTIITSNISEIKKSETDGYCQRLKLCWNRFWSMQISDEEIIRDKGYNAFHYLLFQRYLIILLVIWTILCVFIILPINVLSSSECSGFACTSMENLPPGSWKCWFHANFSIIILVVAIYLMNRFAKELHLDKNYLERRRVLLIRPNSPVNREEHRDIIRDLQVYFSENFPTIKVVGFQLIFDTRKLEDLEINYRSMTDALAYSQAMSGGKNSYQVRPYGCSPWCSCCPSNSFCCPRSTDSVEYYLKQQEFFRKEINEELEKIIRQPLKGFFVEFQTHQMATRVLNAIKYRIGFHIQTKVFDQIENDILSMVQETVDYAPEPDDVNWTSLTIQTNRKCAWKVLCFIILFIIFFFLSTPSYVFNQLNMVTIEILKEGQIIKPNSPIMDYAGPLMAVALTSVMPIIVTKVLQLVPYVTISESNHSIMMYLFFFMVMCIIILPSAGFATANAMLGGIVDIDGNRGNSSSFRWQCLFPADNGAFFIIYIIHASILSNLCEILRIPQLLFYAFYYFLLRTEAEYDSARKNVIIDFPLGTSYTQFLLIFTMTAIFSFAVPLIVPVGLIYMFGKHLVDRYNLYYVYTPTKITSNIHTTAIIFVYVALIMMMLQLFSVFLIKTQYSWISRLVFIILLVTLILTFAQCLCFRIMGSKVKQYRNPYDVCICSYAWPVFLNLIQDGFFITNSYSDNINKNDSMQTTENET